MSSREGFWAAGKQFFRRNPGGLQGKIAPSRGQKTRRLGMLAFFKQALVGHDFEAYLHQTIGGESQYIKGSTAGRDFDGVFGTRWYEAKSGNYWNKLLQDKSIERKFKQKMAEGLKIAQEHGATYELFSNTPIPDSIKEWLTKKGIPFTEILD